jgi:serine/threonine-protein kinase
MGKTAAAKILRPELAANAEIAQRFLNEARAVAQIKHPGVIDIYDFKIHASGAPYIIMELLEGVDLSDLIRRTGRLAEGEAIAIAKAAAEALAATHRLGIVHRDLKPNNVFLIDDPTVPSGQRVKVLDFGIAKLAPQDAGGADTGVNTIMGTPSYMSPEQMRSSRDVDPRSDQYSLGCTLFEMVAGKPPFSGDNFTSIVMAHVIEPAPRLRSLVRVSTELDRLVARMLEKNPAARFRDMYDVVSRSRRPRMRAPARPRHRRPRRPARACRRRPCSRAEILSRRPSHRTCARSRP